MSDKIEQLQTELSETFYQAIQDWSNSTDRSQQQANHKIGVSDLGHCSEKLRRMLNQEQPTQEPDKLAAFIGTWVGGGVEVAIKNVDPSAIIQSEVQVTLETDEGTFQITGHPDVILPDRGVVLDNKTVYTLGAVSAYKQFEDQQKKFQRHTYALAAWEAGMLGDIALKDVLVGNLWVDRSAQDHRLEVKLEPFSFEVIVQVKHWISEAVYAFKHDVEARKEPPREFCKDWCEFFDNCRALDTNVEGLIEDPDAKTAAGRYKEALAMEREAKKIKDEAKSHLVGKEGSTGEWIIKWVDVPATVVPESTRRGYTRLSISAVKGK